MSRPRHAVSDRAWPPAAPDAAAPAAHDAAVPAVDGAPRGRGPPLHTGDVLGSTRLGRRGGRAMGEGREVEEGGGWPQGVGAPVVGRYRPRRGAGGGGGHPNGPPPPAAAVNRTGRPPTGRWGMVPTQRPVWPAGGGGGGGGAAAALPPAHPRARGRHTAAEAGRRGRAVAIATSHHVLGAAATRGRTPPAPRRRGELHQRHAEVVGPARCCRRTIYATCGCLRIQADGGSMSSPPPSTQQVEWAAPDDPPAQRGCRSPRKEPGPQHSFRYSRELSSTLQHAASAP